jgi:hypothetical protein
MPLAMEALLLLRLTPAGASRSLFMLINSRTPHGRALDRRGASLRTESGHGGHLGR